MNRDVTIRYFFHIDFLLFFIFFNFPRLLPLLLLEEDPEELLLLLLEFLAAGVRTSLLLDFLTAGEAPRELLPELLYVPPENELLELFC